MHQNQMKILDDPANAVRPEARILTQALGKLPHRRGYWQASTRRSTPNRPRPDKPLRGFP
jgi:hypothetical protein